MRHHALLPRYRALQTELSQPDLREVAIRRHQMLRDEVALLERIGPADDIRFRPPRLLVEELASRSLSPADELVLAGFCALHGMRGLGEAALARANGRDPALQEGLDRQLAALRGEAVPPGGYVRYRGVWYASAAHARTRDLDGALDALAQAVVPDVEFPFAVTGEQSHAARFDKMLGKQAVAWLLDAAARVRAALRDDYGLVRGGWVSHADPQARVAQLERFAALLEEQRQMRTFLLGHGRGDRDKLASEHERLRVVITDFRAMRGADRVDAWTAVSEAVALLERIERRELALHAVGQYLTRHERASFAPVTIQSDPYAEVTSRHLLDGRAGSGLEDVLWLALQLGARRYPDVIEQAHVLRGRARELTEWERMVLDETLAGAIVGHNAVVATSLDRREREVVRRVNEFRRVVGLLPLEVDERLVVAARRHSRAMAAHGFLAHVSPVRGARTATERARALGYAGTVGENVAVAGVDEHPLDIWLKTPDAVRNLISDAAQLGVGRSCDGRRWTLKLGRGDAGWRALHRGLDSYWRARLAAVTERITVAGRARVAPDELDRMTRGLLPWLLAPLCRRVFPGREPAHADHGAHVELLGLLVRADLDAPWRPLRLAAVDAVLDVMQSDPAPAARRRALALVDAVIPGALLAGGGDFAPGAPAAHRAKVTAQIRDRWEQTEGVMRPPGTVARVPGRVATEPREPVPVRPAWQRLGLARKFGGGQRTEQAVERGLRWLASVQDDDGAWRARSFAATSARLRAIEPRTVGLGDAEWEIAMTGLSVLAMIAAGNTLEDGQLADNVARGVEFLLLRLGDDGSFTTRSSHYMYSHAIATQALCELYAHSGEPLLAEAAQLAVDFLVAAQDPETGGWRYDSRSGADTSVTGWVVLALATAERAGIEVGGFRGARRFLQRVTEPAFYRIGYQRNRDEEFRNRLGAVGMLSWIFLGTSPRDPRVIQNAERLLDDRPTMQDRDFYYWYYGTLALFQVGGDDWKEWHGALSSVLLGSQVADRRSPLYGSWHPDGHYGQSGGRIFATALGVLMLTTYYRYERGPREHLHPFTGDIGAELKRFLELLGAPRDPQQQHVAERIMVDRYGGSMVPALAAVLADRARPAVFRRRIARLLAEVAEPQHERMVTALLDDPDLDTVAILASALDVVTSRKSAEQLEKQLAHDNPTVRSAAARALGRIGDRRATDALRARAAIERDAGCRATLERAQRRAETGTILAEVVGDALGSSEVARLEIQEQLQAILGDRLIELLGEVRANEPDLLARCRTAVTDRRARAVVPILLTLLESQDLVTRIEATRVLKAVTWQNHGFQPDARRPERQAALARWHTWWTEHQRRY